MKNFETYGVQEISESSMKLTNGGTDLGEAVGKFFGALLRYSGPYGNIYAYNDYIISKM